MDLKIPAGIKFLKEKKVTENDLATAFGSGDVPVFATPAMIALLEQTAKESVLEFLPEGFTTVGTEINIKHLKASSPASIITAESYLRSMQGVKLIFELHAWDQKGLIGIGTHTRVIVNEKEFLDKL
ncbi:MAG TPA: thioesterase family protein [Bacteroidales bacterium]|nr:thioesterase family protein [Bacteroidales bacterium]HPE56000.1 thioesterase family protein [Bacteroidales bacterium]HRX96162.1 thioesterase family protein [Bacteroidales bacterium]